MEEVLNNQPFLHAMMWACCNVILVMFPDFRDGFIWELLNSRNPIPKGIIGLAYRKVLGQECIGTSIPCSECLLIGVESRLGLPKQREWEQPKMDIIQCSTLGVDSTTHFQEVLEVSVGIFICISAERTCLDHVH